ncbi:MAG: cell division protein FtsA [Candidatus Harrisonbacteria bacterium CG10_big_fil_rev_8_21_14_0_10_40_38]|uniref:Cell division protein FtsA n=1 Tax=Candidatus Harrisonbacteria bacterium CG10_big_fil_rev_8_21_14_0_10_40_38 TaxID=1974583 RepID=A0A2H0UTL3_9BACT|nr:MAG: cell division protein FtsA [Candidatus Harrisonbacteria bacterium CG10_big_fil_rev_8_21_14_0_10_40_38]
MSQFIIGLDIGSRTIKAAIGEIRRDRELVLFDIITAPSNGMRKGVVSELSDLTQSISPVIGEIRNLGKKALSNIYVGLGSSDLKVHSSIGVVAVSRADYEIYQDDVNRAAQSAQAINIAPNRMVLHAVVKEYIVDGVKDIRDPLGMVGNRLEVSSIIIDAFAPAIKSVTKCVEVLGGSISGLILSPLADARTVLTKNQKELGVVLINIGFGKTSMCVYEEGKLMHASIFPVGSGNITNDLAIGLKIPVDTAETIKLSFGNALAREVSARDTIELSKIDSSAKGTVPRRFISEIIEVRLAEILELVNNELRRIGKEQLPGGVVLTGGGVKLPGIADLVRQELKMSTQIGVPHIEDLEIVGDDLHSKIEDPEYITALGLLLWGKDKHLESKNINIPMSGFLKKAIRYFTP